MKTSISALLTATTDEVLEHCVDELTKYYPRVNGQPRVFIHKDDFVYAVGTNPICIVAHIDTVRDRQTTGKTFRASVGGEKPVVLRYNRNVVTNDNGILGADDRAGVYGCLDLVRRCHREKLPMPSVILCNGEESGGLGVGVFVKTEAFKTHDKGTRLFVEMDRCNGTEWVTYGSRLPENVINYVESFGFRSGHGSYSDIADLQEAYLIPAVNLSIGYYAQHTDRESLHLDEMHLTIQRVLGMLRDPIDTLYPVTKKYVWTNNRSSYTPAYYNKDVGGSKNVNGGRGNVSASSSLPPEKQGFEGIDKVIDAITWGGYCKECGFPWADCTCGDALALLLTYLEDDELVDLMENYLATEDPMYEMLDTYLKAWEEANGKVIDVTPEEDKTADPHHVAKEGEVLLITDKAAEQADIK